MAKIYENMSTPAIKEEFIGRIKKDEALKFDLAMANDVKIRTIDRWLRDNDETLTTVRNLIILKKHFGVLEAEELLEGIPAGDAIPADAHTR